MTRFFDLVFAMTGLLLLCPLFMLIWILGLLETGSPVFTQTRVGRNRQPFVLVKFRTMYPNTRSMATHLIDTRSVTRLGSFLRRTKLDEIPQLINVIRGEMSLVGPRPCLLNQTELIEERQLRGVFEVLPGITGLAQINGVDMSTPKELAEWDSRMIKTMSLKKYFIYIVQTLSGKGNGDRIQV